ncbi:CoA ester lyase [Maricurvus nonylphenolicus]|uniref:HpcH/HpaI aldolase/citrate lyase family protein n=1 Tax=Maricurvus nonylphenolicus TaxID=1008307 RepID=UPI0036F2E6F0
MSQNIKRRRRCMMSVPGSSVKKIEKAVAMDVDFIFLDLEDAVAPSMKPEARKNVIKAFNELDWGDTVRCFRMNGIDSHWAIEDLMEVVSAAGNNIDTLVIPKVKYARDVHFVETMLDLIEAENGIEKKIGFELLIEEVEGILNIKEIAEASDRVESLMFGIGDYTRAQGVDIRDAFGKPRFYPGDIWYHQRSTLALTAKTIGADFVDGPWAPIPDMDGYRNECRMVKTLGGVGKWAIHPSQVPVAQEEFGPSREEIDISVKMLALFKEASAQGKGAIKAPDGSLLDEAAIPMLQSIIDQAEFFGIPLEA